MVVSSAKLQLIANLLEKVRELQVQPSVVRIRTVSANIEADLVSGIYPEIATVQRPARNIHLACGFCKEFQVLFFGRTPDYINNDQPNQVIMMPEGSYPVYGYEDGMVTVYGFEG